MCFGWPFGIARVDSRRHAGEERNLQAELGLAHPRRAHDLRHGPRGQSAAQGSVQIRQPGGERTGGDTAAQQLQRSERTRAEPAARE